MKSKKQEVLDSLGFSASYLMYHWTYGNNNGGEKEAYLSVKELLKSSKNTLKLQKLRFNISFAIENWEDVALNIDEKYPVENSLPEINTFCKILINILDEIIIEKK